MDSNNNNNNNNNNRVRSSSFEWFFSEWLIRQQQYLEELEIEIDRNSSSSSSSINNGDDDDDDQEEEERRRKELISRILEHYREYYAAKARVAREDVFLILNPPWMTSLERCYLWLSGLRPGIAFQIISNFVFHLTEEQSRRINLLMDEIKGEVRQLTDILTGVQRAMVAPATAAVAHEHVGQVQNGELLHLQHSTVDSFQESMEALVESADYLRGKTVLKILEILTSSQALRFLAAVAQFHLSLRSYGQRRQQAEHQTPSDLARQNTSI